MHRRARTSVVLKQFESPKSIETAIEHINKYHSKQNIQFRKHLMALIEKIETFR